MRMARGAAAVLAGVLVAATASSGRPAATPRPGLPGTVSWSPPLAGEAVGVAVAGGTAPARPGPRGSSAPRAPTATATSAPPGC